MSALKAEILAYVKQVGAAAAGKAMGAPTSVVQRWVKGTHSPSLTHVEKYLLMKGPQQPVRAPVSAEDDEQDMREPEVVLPSGAKVPKIRMEPLDIEDPTPILTRKAVAPAPRAKGLAAPEAGDVVVDETISKRLPDSIAKANMTVNPFGGNETPIVGPAKVQQASAQSSSIESAPPPINMPSGVMSEAEYKRAMDNVHREPTIPAQYQPRAPANVPMFEGISSPATAYVPPAPALEKPQLHVEHNYTLEQLQQMRNALFNWTGRELAILVPIYKYVNPATNYCIAAIIKDLGDKAHYFQEIGDGVIANSRNKLATKFLQTNTVWSFWIDDDMVLPIGRPAWFKEMCSLPPDFPDQVAGQHAVTRLLSHKKHFVAGTYFSRTLLGRPMSYEGQVHMADHMAARNMEDSIRPATWAGTGCMLVHRQVYHDIQRTQPEIAPAGGRAEWDFFRMPDTAGEDVGFCLRAQKAGHQLFIDTGLQCGHVGYNVWGAWNTRGGTVV